MDGLEFPAYFKADGVPIQIDEDAMLNLYTIDGSSKMGTDAASMAGVDKRLYTVVPPQAYTIVGWYKFHNDARIAAGNLAALQAWNIGAHGTLVASVLNAIATGVNISDRWVVADDLAVCAPLPEKGLAFSSAANTTFLVYTSGLYVTKDGVGVYRPILDTQVAKDDIEDR